MASIGSMTLYCLERATQENFLLTAQSSTAIYSLANTLGVSPKRYTSATCQATISLPGPYNISVVIPANSQFTISPGNINFFNQNNIIFAPGVVSVPNVVLEQGLITSETFNSTGLPYQTFYASSGFVATDDFLVVTVNGQIWTGDPNALWLYGSSDIVYLYRTMPDGSIQISFGDGTFGLVPVLGASIVATYSISAGVSGNIPTTGNNVTLITPLLINGAPTAVTGVTTTSAEGGDFQESSNEIKVTAPRLYASADRAITRNDYKAIATKFPYASIVDAIAWGEFEENSTDNTLMNIVNLTVLPSQANTYTNINIGTGTGASVSNEVDASGNGTTKIFTFTLGSNPVVKNTVSITYTISGAIHVATDNGSGLITGTDISSGTINYGSGAISLTFTIAPDNNTAIQTSYSYGLSVFTATLTPQVQALSVQVSLSNSSAMFLTDNGGLTDNEIEGTGNGLTKVFSFGLGHVPVVAGTITFTYTIGGIVYTANDNSIGNILGINITNGTINYTTGVVSLTFTPVPDNNTFIYASYQYVGILTGSIGTGTINYATGALSVTFNAAPLSGVNVLVSYQQNGLTSTQQALFQTYISTKKHLSTIVNLVPPVDIPTPVSITVYYLSGYVASTIQTLATTAINNLFIRGSGILGKTLFYSKIISVVMAITGVDHVELTAPTADVDSDFNQFVNLSSLTVNVLPA